MRVPPARPSAVVCDLDRTLAEPDAELEGAAIEAIGRVQAGGARFLIASGRPAEYLRSLWSRHPSIDALVAENGAVLLLGSPARAPVPLVAWPEGEEVRRAISDLGLTGVDRGEVILSVRREDWPRLAPRLNSPAIHRIDNVDRVMLVPAGVTKLSGVLALLDRLGLSRPEFAAIGDGENDRELLAAARVSGAPANALAAIRSEVDFVAVRPGALGVGEFLDHLGFPRASPAEPPGGRTVYR